MTLSKRLMVVTVAVALVTALVTTALVQSSFQATVTPLELARTRALVHRMAADLGAYVRDVRADTRVALKVSSARSLVAAATRDEALPEATRNAAIAVFSAFLKTKPSYLQMRLIGTAHGGRELIRVQRPRTGEPVRVVPDGELQQKGHRRYFKRTLRLEPDQVFVSEVDLNEEHGRVQVPHVPVLRAGAVVLGPGGQPRGALITNVDVGAIFERMRAVARTEGAFLIDAHGDYLMHADPAAEFARDLGRARRFQNDFPKLAGRLASSEPWTAEVGLGGRAVTLVATPITLAGGPRVTLIAPTSSAAGAAQDDMRPVALVTALLAGLFAALGALLVARSVARPLRRITDATAGYSHGHSLDLPVDASGEVGALARALSQMQDTIRKNRAALEAQQSRFKQVFEAAPTAMLMVDRNHRITLANPPAARLFDYPLQELLGMDVGELVPEAHRAAHRNHVEAFIATDEARAMSTGMALSGRRRDGTQVPVEIGLSPVQGSEGPAILASVIDTTERRRYEQGLRRSNEELEQFAYVASHDLQEPLRMVTSYVQLLARRYEGQGDAETDQYVRFALEGARRCRELINDLLQYSRVGSQGRALKPVRPNEVLEKVLMSLRTLVTEADATVDVAPLPEVQADASQLGQVFQNLISNAIKFRGDEAPHIQISGDVQGPLVRFAVRDNGIGIAPQHAERIFQMFQRLHARDKYPGSGIGLSIAKRIVERHSGTIWLESTQGEGTTFYFTLRAATQARAHAPKADSTTHDTGDGPAREPDKPATAARS